LKNPPDYTEGQAMNAHTYSINTDVKFAPLELIDVGQLAADCQQQWLIRRSAG
jgi:hypothetical protein